jgi:hypothetical protein
MNKDKSDRYSSGGVISESHAKSAGYTSSETNDFDPVRGEKALWQAVITQALMDARCESKKSEARQQKQQAIRWLLKRSEDFFWVCNLANLDPHYVLKKNREALSRNCKWRAEAGNAGTITV